jgi:TolB-like protein
MRFMRIIVLVAAALMLLCGVSIAQQSQPVRVAVLPFTVHSAEDLSYLRNGIWDIISTRIIVEGKIEVVDKPLVERFLTDMPSEVSDQQARWLGTRVGADYVVYGSITKVGEYISLDAKIVSVAGQRETSSVFAQHKGMDEVMTKVGAFAQDISSRIMGQGTSYERKGPGQARQYMMFQSLGYSKLMRFAQRILKGVDVGDVDGDGKNEIVVMDHYHIWVYRDEGKDTKLVGEFQGSSSDNFLTLDVIDVNGDKRADICVTDVVGEDLQSFILTFENGSFRYLAKRLDCYLRVVKIPEKGDCLVGQRMGPDRDYEGRPQLVVWTGKKVKLGKQLKTGKKGQVPTEAEWLYTFTAGKFTAAEALKEYLVLMDTGQIRLLDANGDLQWKSSDDFGGSDNYIDRPTVMADKRGATTDNIARRIYIPVRMVAKDLDGDGIDEMVTAINKFALGQVLTKVRVYDKGYVTALSWDGMSMASVWRTQDIPGCVADFQVKDVDNDGVDELVVVAVSAHLLDSEANSVLLIYRLYE